MPSSARCRTRWRPAPRSRWPRPSPLPKRCGKMSTPSAPGSASPDGRELNFGEAIREALAEELRRDPRVFMIGEDIAEAGTAFKVLNGLVEEFGPQRIIDSPISEPGITGLAVGAAMTGMRPVVDIMFGDFVGLIM